MREYYTIKSKIVKGYLDKYPDALSRTLARMLYNDFPEFFSSIEQARSSIRLYRGRIGERSRRKLKDKRYVKQIQSS